ncbi:hypothetical protein FHR32_003614 [Streptosporangium album]|uniref:DUF4352 domain-containing protein n=1 Tax=Streptosporangium album TaxID=47479 RepID=A0A7W7RW24_9ACTN|nr:hypothetical protein [Streptosporangium album]MBB4939309.1 hypothetical protein [Streptosporangium album]
MTSPPGGETRPRRPVAVPIAALFAATGLGVVAALGGFGKAPEEPPKQLGPGASLDQGEFMTTFVESRTTAEPGSFGGPSKRFLEVVLKVVNKGDETTGVGSPWDQKNRGRLFGAGLLKLTPEIKTPYGPTASIVDQGVPSTQLHPGITSTVVVRYELPERQRPPRQVKLDVGTFEYNKGFTQDLGWLPVQKDDDGPPAVAAQVTLPVRQKGTG